MDANVGNRVITYYDREGHEGRVRYRDLMIQMGEDRLVSLSDLLLEEQEKVAEFTRNADKLSDKIRALDSFYDGSSATSPASTVRPGRGSRTCTGSTSSSASGC